ncbi:KN motif and ankyrin repeat domain-containing protein 2-like [Juglans microcarpa x Juglans regia]|uniref:KN motif and ankyrin repeat domain-containing protein 2-like n=1 Tax=Juglans microcarpa x Juglans regia TaxID=2249226 RepID=UPI001B7DEDF1|nr:KN motif and ankyrin repeat domain-containing protein 2-like [Juglans microcarpa x Juglans regia]
MAIGKRAKLIADTEKRATHEKKKKIADKGNMIDKSYLNYADLYKAVLRGKLKAAQEFLDSQPEAVRTALTDKGETALHIAVTAGHANIVKELVARMTKEDLGIEDGDGCTALMKALEYGRSELVRYLYTRTNPMKDQLPAEKDKKGAMLLTRAIYSRNLGKNIWITLHSRYTSNYLHNNYGGDLEIR